MFKTRFISMLVLLMTAVTGAWAETITVTINQSDWGESGNSFTKDGVTVSATMIMRDDFMLFNGGTFSTTLGNFTKIVVTAQDTGYNTGWNDGTWTGTPASTVSFDEIFGFVTTIVCTIEPPTVAVTGVTLAPTSATLTLGETETVTLIPTVLPGDATDKSVTWSSSNEAVATVADGVVTAVAAGEATITVTTTDGAKTATCAVTVAAPAASTYTVTLKEGTEDADNWTITPAEATTTGVAAGTEVKATYGGAKKVKSVKAVKKAKPAAPTLAATMTTAGMTVKVNYNYYNEENYCLFTSNGDGTYTFQSGSGFVGGDENAAKALVVEDGKLVFKQNFYNTIDGGWDRFGFSVTFDTSNNTYTQWAGVASQDAFSPSLTSVEVNGTQIAVTAAPAPAATVTTAPTAKTGVKAGEDEAIVNEGTAEGGTMMYMVNATQPASTEGFSATVPTAEGLTAGTYYVWYYVKADATHTDSEISASGIEVTIAAAAPAIITVTWNNDDITDTGDNYFTKDGVTITAGMIDFDYKDFDGGGTFTTTLGNFTKIEVTAVSVDVSGTGWSGSTWTGNASSVSFSGNISGYALGITFVFTIEPTN